MLTEIVESGDAAKGNKQRLTARDHCLVLLLFVFLTSLYLFPFILHPNGFDGSGDDAVFTNAFWWFRNCLSTLQNPFHSTHLFFPDGMNLVFHTVTYSNFLLTLPLNLLFGSDVAVNFAYFMSFILAAYFTFLLVHNLTGSRWGAFIAALIFSFSPFHFGHGRGHLQMATLQWLPLYFLLLKHAIENRKVSRGVFAGTALALVILTDQLQTICAALSTAILLAAVVISWRKDSRRLKLLFKQMCVMTATASVLASFYLYPLLKELLHHNSATKIPPLEHGGANMFSADLLGFFLPGFHPVWGGLFSSFNLVRDSNVYVSAIAIILALIGAWQWRREPVVKLAAFLGLCFWIMSLGTYLHINGVWEFSSGRIPLPYLAMTDIPLLGENRTPSRFHFMTLLAVATLAGYGVAALLQRFPTIPSSRRNIILVLLSMLILIETMPRLQTPGSTHVPSLYRDIARDGGRYTILQFPLSRWSALLKNGSGSPSSMMYYQTVHGKPIFGGLASRLTPEELDFKDSLLSMMTEIAAMDQQNLRSKIIPSPEEFAAVRQQGRELNVISRNFADKYAIKYVVMHAPLSGDTLIRAFLEEFIGSPSSDVPADGISYFKIN